MSLFGQVNQFGSTHFILSNKNIDPVVSRYLQLAFVLNSYVKLASFFQFMVLF